MKKYLAFILIIIAVGFGAYEFKNKIPGGTRDDTVDLAEETGHGTAVVGLCDQPFLYSVGNIDSRFGINEESLANLAKEAEDIWDQQTGKNIFAYDSASSFKINLVFDERQEKTLETEALEQKLKKLELTDAGLKKQYDATYANYSKKTDDYNALVKKYEKKQKNYNNDVSYWNSQGGAPEDEFEKLQDEKEELEDDYKELDKKRKEINKLVKEINVLAEKESKLVSDYNQKVNTYKSKYGVAREFEKGVYNGREINIYQFNENNDLRLVLAHELGHALGIGHVENPQSLMYYLMSEQDLDASKLTLEDVAAMNKICGQ